MAEKYTWDDIIINPNDPRLEGAIGKECYCTKSTSSLLVAANNENVIHLFKLSRIDKNPCATVITSSPFTVSNKESTSKVDFIILKKDQPQKSYAERQAEWIKENDIKIGDKVRVTRKTKNGEDGWKGTWAKPMDSCINLVCDVEDIDDLGIRCDLFYFPYFVIEKVTPKYVPFDLSKEEDRDIIRDKWLIKLYCGNFAKEECKVVGFSENSAVLSSAYDDGYGHQTRCFTGTELLNGFTFLDGTPCGKEVLE